MRTITAAKGDVGETVTLTGQILAENEVSLAFRIGGQILKRFANVGDRSTRQGAGDARSGGRTERAALGDSCVVRRRRSIAGGEQHLRSSGPSDGARFTTRVNYDQAQQGRQTAQARVDDARAQLDQAQDRVSFTELKSTVTGAVTARNAEAGEVVQPGQAIFQVAREDGRDAVFDVPAQVLRAAPPDATIDVTLTDDKSVTAKARVRTVDPQADPITRTFRVRMSLIDHPEAMRLGATVTGRLELDAGPGIAIPASALTQTEGRPAVWLVDPATETVSLHNVEVQRLDPGTVVVSGGLAGGEVVVTAGVQALHPGQKVRLLGAAS